MPGSAEIRRAVVVYIEAELVGEARLLSCRFLEKLGFLNAGF